MLRVVSIVAVAACLPACGGPTVTSPSGSVGGGPASPSAAIAPCEWTHEYDRLPPGTVMGGPAAAPADGGAPAAAPAGDGG